MRRSPTVSGEMSDASSGDIVAMPWDVERKMKMRAYIGPPTSDFGLPGCRDLTYNLRYRAYRFRRF